jgi:hypothetical protein
MHPLSYINIIHLCLCEVSHDIVRIFFAIRDLLDNRKHIVISCCISDLHRDMSKTKPGRNTLINTRKARARASGHSHKLISGPQMRLSMRSNSAKTPTGQAGRSRRRDRTTN